MREVPKKNYIIMLLVIIFVVVITIALANAYNNRVKKTSVMSNFLSEINEKDLDTYIKENPNIVIYVADKYNLDNDEQEEKIKKLMIESNISDYFVYLSPNDNKKLFSSLSKNYDGNISTEEMPVLIVFEEGKIVNCYYDIDKIDLNEVIGVLK